MHRLNKMDISNDFMKFYIKKRRSKKGKSLQSEHNYHPKATVLFRLKILLGKKPKKNPFD